jgi:hypothetical protein
MKIVGCTLALLLALVSAVPAVAGGRGPSPSGYVWTKGNADASNPLRIQWMKKSGTPWVLDSFYWGDVREFFTSKEVGMSRTTRVRLLNKEKLTFNPSTGAVLLGSREVGTWRSPNGFEFRAPVRIDPFRNTIRILVD